MSFDGYQQAIVKIIESDIDVDQKSVWTLINQRKPKQPVCRALQKNGMIYSTPPEINEIWFKHFSMVFGHSTFDEPGRADELARKVASIRDNAFCIKEKDNTRIDLKDLQNICYSLDTGKACGHDNISYEHVKYGGNLLYRHLCHLFNLCLQLSYIPEDWRKRIIILLCKGDNKSRTDVNSYRGIS